MFIAFRYAFTIRNTESTKLYATANNHVSLAKNLNRNNKIQRGLHCIKTVNRKILRDLGKSTETRRVLIQSRKTLVDF
jgi:hypothetical protein